MMLCGTTSIGAAESPAAAAGTPLAWAERLAQETRPENTDYRHKNTQVSWAGVDGATLTISRTDCSGLINDVLQQSYGFGPDHFRQWLGKARPLASSYHDAIERQSGFRRIEAVEQIRPGDLIAIRYPDGSPNSGHIMIAAQAVAPHPRSSPAVDGTRQWTVKVIDSSQSGHGKSDSRYQGSRQFHSGVGRGTLRLYSGAGGRIAGYTWSVYPNSEYYPLEQRHLVVGRVERD
jgi:cell wall-associated NlpC family hydrolase